MKSNKSRSSGSGSFSERYSGGARESKIVDREFRVFLITSFYPLLPLSLCLRRCCVLRFSRILHLGAMSFYIVRPNRRVCRASVYSHTNDYVPSLPSYPCLLRAPLTSLARLNLLLSGPLVQPRADVRANSSSSSSFCTFSVSLCHHCAASPLSTALSPPRNTFGRV